MRSRLIQGEHHAIRPSQSALQQRCSRNPFVLQVPQADEACLHRTVIAGLRRSHFRMLCVRQPRVFLGCDLKAGARPASNRRHGPENSYCRRGCRRRVCRRPYGAGGRGRDVHRPMACYFASRSWSSRSVVSCLSRSLVSGSLGSAASRRDCSRRRSSSFLSLLSPTFAAPSI